MAMFSNTSNKKPTYSWEKTYHFIKNKHDEAFKAIDQAISLEEREKPKEVSIFKIILLYT